MKFLLLLPGVLALFWPPLADGLAEHSRLVLVSALGATVCAWPRGDKGVGSIATFALVVPWLVAAWRLDVDLGALGVEALAVEGVPASTGMFVLALLLMIGATWWGAVSSVSRSAVQWTGFVLFWLLPALVGWWGHEAQISLAALHWFPLPAWGAATPVGDSSLTAGLHAVLVTFGIALATHWFARRAA